MTLKKKHLKILKEAEEYDQQFTGWNHRIHRTNKYGTGSKKKPNVKKEKIIKLRESELRDTSSI